MGQEQGGNTHNKISRKRFFLGAALALIPGIVWGLSGVFGQYMFREKGISAEWLVSTRLLIAGILMIAFSFIRQGKADTMAIFSEKRDFLQVIVFGVFGLAAVQLTYFVTIDKSNAPTATILQYTFPVMIVIWLAMRNRKLPAKKEWVAVVSAVIGIFLLVTHGNPATLSITPEALAWGLISAVAMTFYTLYPGKLQAKWSSPVVVGWGMLVGALVLNVYHPFWNFTGELDGVSIAMTLYIAVLATCVSFYMYLVSVTMIGGTYASLFACIEPLASAVFSVMGLGLVLHTMDLIGAALILAAMFLLST